MSPAARLFHEVDDQVERRNDVRPHRLVAVSCAPCCPVCAGKNMRRQGIEYFIAGQAAQRVLHRDHSSECPRASVAEQSLSTICVTATCPGAPATSLSAPSRAGPPHEALAWRDTPWD